MEGMREIRGDQLKDFKIYDYLIRDREREREREGRKGLEDGLQILQNVLFFIFLNLERLLEGLHAMQTS